MPETEKLLLKIYNKIKDLTTENLALDTSSTADLHSWTFSSEKEIESEILLLKDKVDVNEFHRLNQKSEQRSIFSLKGVEFNSYA